MNYHVGRDGQQLGVFTREQIASGLASGTLRATDMAWTEGMGQWQPIASLFPQGAGAPPSGQVHLQPAPPPGFPGQPQTCGLAIASLVLGILSFVVCCLASLPAVICGHLALGRIKRSGETLGGRGMAVAGLIMGYLYMGVAIVGIGFFLPLIKTAAEATSSAVAENNARQLMIELKAYATSHDGKYPGTLEELIQTNPDLEKLLAPPLSALGWTTERGFEYSGGNEADPPNKVVLISRYHSATGQRVVAHNDGSVVIQNNTRSP